MTGEKNERDEEQKTKTKKWHRTARALPTKQNELRAVASSAGKAPPERKFPAQDPQAPSLPHHTRRHGHTAVSSPLLLTTGFWRAQAAGIPVLQAYPPQAVGSWANGASRSLWGKNMGSTKQKEAQVLSAPRQSLRERSECCMDTQLIILWCRSKKKRHFLCASGTE